jgi:chemotaxis protein CheD
VTRPPANASIPFQADGMEEVPVRMGELRAAGTGSLLFSIGLGSCVAVALYDAAARVGGLAHVMLPQPAAGRAAVPPGRYAGSAVLMLIEMMESRGAGRESLRARLAGGASMFRDVLDGEGLRLGRRNVEAARSALAAAGVPVESEDVYGSWGRSVYLRTTDGQLLVTSVTHGDVIL